MRKKYLKHLFLLFLSMGILYACLDEISSLRTKQLSPEVEAAIAWFEINIAEGYVPWQAAGDNNFLQPNWKKTISNSDLNYEVTEIRLEGEKDFLQTAYENSERFRETGDARYLASDMRLVLRTDRETGEKIGFVMVAYPDLAYLEKNLDNPLRSFSYLKQPKGFTGFVYFYDLTGELMVGWRYTIEGVYPLLSEKILTEQPQLRSTGTRCYVACEVWINGTGWHTEYKTTFGDPYAGGCFPLSCDEPPRDPTLPPEIYYPQPPTPPPPTITPPADSSVPACGQGAVGRNLNQTMLSNSIVKSRMDNVLRPKVSHHNRWAVSIGRNGSTYHVSDAREGNSTSVSIPSNPGGNLVATAKSHANGIAVPSAGDVYTFLEQVSGSPRTMEVMYTYGWGFDGEIEVYAINVHNREAASNFLNQYLKGHNLNSSGTEFIGEIGVAFNYAKNMYNEALSIELYPFRQNAVALSYVMNKFNMGITLTRKVGNGDFRTIAAMDETSGFHPMFVHLCM